MQAFDARASTSTRFDVTNTYLANTHLVVCYGSLRRGCSNHTALQGQRFVSICKTRDRFALRLARWPMVTRDKQVHQITGEVYKIDVDCLALLDDIEGHPTFYRREQIPVTLADDSEVTAWLYFFDAELPQDAVLIPSGDYFDAVESNWIQKEQPDSAH